MWQLGKAPNACRVCSTVLLCNVDMYTQTDRHTFMDKASNSNGKGC